ncbi:hypothetical protein DSL72_005926 [Monilinia vaccinii-corymbosi]|uniref:BZIP domain-containing protein n=1 Tax=Monilinia vaccinii-corymbosi TaxID=61207 RepID=A0A8A3PH20_9HELO|nr:hypothetical protein DSL72_005926 [Monilinia vaccinii-corymbosi]
MSQEKANLARIRDNQRRSRARRKEYLQELEARLRQCEVQGIEASSEIQMAARRVADENKKLRNLLAQHGVGNDIVEPYLHLSSDDLMSTQYGSESTSVQQLEHLLQTRKIYGGDGNGNANANGNIGPASATTMGQTVQSRESSCSGNTAHSVWDPVYTSRSLSVGQAQTFLSNLKGVSSSQQFMESRRSSAASRHSSISISQNHNPGRNIHSQQQHQQQHQQQQQQRYNMQITLPNTQQQQHSTSSSLLIQTQTTPIYDFDPQYLSSQSYTHISPQTPHIHSQTDLQSQSHQSHSSHPNPSHQPAHTTHSHQTSSPLSTPYTASRLFSTSSNSNPTTHTNTNNMNSCTFATNLISNMSHTDSAIVRAELGCETGMDCSVDNQLVFNVMDRYTGSGVGL